jgi:hypothetical protein
MGLRVWSGRWTDRHANRPAFLRACVGLSAAVRRPGAAVLAGRDPALGPAGPGHAAGAGRPRGVGLAWRGLCRARHLAGARQAGSALGLANTAVFIACFHPHADPASAGLAGLAPVWLAAGGAALLPLPLLVPGAGPAQ